MHEALISIKPTYVRKFLAGEKSVEIRNRTVNLAPDSRLWIYTTRPRGCIEAVALVRHVVLGTPSDIWHRYRDALAVSRIEYLEYVNGASQVSAILTSCVFRLPVELNLSLLRERVPKFHPPQFVKYMADSDPLFIRIIELLCAETDEAYMRRMGLTRK